MVSLIKGNGTECAGHLAVGAAGRAAERDGGRASAGTPGRGGTALHPRGDRRPHPQGADLFGRAAGAPSGADEEVSAGVCHLLRAGRRRSAGRLGGGTGRRRGSAGSAHRRCGFRRRLRGLCHVLDGRDPAPLLRREPHLQLCTGCVPHPPPGGVLQQPQLEAYPAGVPGLVDGVAGAGAALHGGGCPARACYRLAGGGRGAGGVYRLAVRGDRDTGEEI